MRRRQQIKMRSFYEVAKSFAADAMESISEIIYDSSWNQYDMQTVLDLFRVGMGKKSYYPMIVASVIDFLTMARVNKFHDEQDIAALKQARAIVLKELEKQNLIEKFSVNFPEINEVMEEE